MTMNKFTTLTMTAIQSHLKVDGKNPVATLILSGFNDKKHIAVNGGWLLNLLDENDYKRVTLLTRMTDCGMRFDQLAPNNTEFKAILIPNNNASNGSEVIVNMDPIAIGIGNNFILRCGNEVKLYSESEAYIRIANMMRKENRKKS